jgi:Virulence factor
MPASCVLAGHAPDSQTRGRRYVVKALACYRVSAKLVTIYWRDIPAQVNAQRGRVREQRVLPRRFQRAIERATRKADITTADVYVRQWRREAVRCGDDLLAEALAGAAAVEARYPQERLAALAANLGWEPSDPTSPTAAGDVGGHNHPLDAQDHADDEDQRGDEVDPNG